MQCRLLLETEFSTRLNEAAAVVWQASVLKTSLGAGDAHHSLPGSSRGALVSETGCPQNKREKKNRAKSCKGPSFEGGRAKRPGARARGERSVRVGRHREKRTAASRELVWCYSHTFHSSS